MPTVFKKAKDVEYTIFLTFDMDEPHTRNVYRRVLRQLLDEIARVLQGLKIDTSSISRDASGLIGRGSCRPEDDPLRIEAISRINFERQEEGVRNLLAVRVPDIPDTFFQSVVSIDARRSPPPSPLRGGTSCTAEILRRTLGMPSVRKISPGTTSTERRPKQSVAAARSRSWARTATFQWDRGRT